MRSNLVPCLGYLRSRLFGQAADGALAALAHGMAARAFASVASFALGLAIFAGTARAGTVHGHAVQKNYAPDGSVLEVSEVAFKITVSGADYAMELVPTNVASAGATPPANYWTRAQGLLHRSEIYSAGDEADRLKHCSGYLYNEVMPLAGTDCAPLLWMVYAWNHADGNDPESPRLRPVWQTEYERVWRRGITLPVRLGFSKEFSDRPDSVTFMNDGRVRSLDIDGRPTIRFAPAPFNRGYVNARVELDLASLTPGVSVPGGAKYRRYSPNLKHAASTNDVWLVESVDIVTLHTAVESEPVALPKLLPVAALHDCRSMRELPDFMPVYRVINNGQWAYPNPAVIEKLRAEYQKSATPREPVATYMMPKPRAVLAALFAPGQ
jgi:hypothetical protein